MNHLCSVVGSLDFVKPFRTVVSVDPHLRRLPFLNLMLTTIPTRFRFILFWIGNEDRPADSATGHAAVLQTIFRLNLMAAVGIDSRFNRSLAAAVLTGIFKL